MVLHVVVVSRPFVRCIETRNDVVSGEVAGERFVRRTKMIRSRFLEIPSYDGENGFEENEVDEKEDPNRGQELLRKNSPSTWPYSLKTFM